MKHFWPILTHEFLYDNFNKKILLISCVNIDGFFKMKGFIYFLSKSGALKRINKTNIYEYSEKKSTVLIASFKFVIYFLSLLIFLFLLFIIFLVFVLIFLFFFLCHVILSNWHFRFWALPFGGKINESFVFKSASNLTSGFFMTILIREFC